MRIRALDAHPHRWEQAVSATLSAALVSPGTSGWARLAAVGYATA